MLRTGFLSLCLIAFWAAFPATASAQRPGFGRPKSPTISPYLNLLRGGGIGSNFYQRVRPEQEFRRANRDLNRSVDSLQRQIQNQQNRGMQPQSGLSQTGHVPRFMNLGNFFPGLIRR